MKHARYKLFSWVFLGVPLAIACAKASDNSSDDDDGVTTTGGFASSGGNKNNTGGRSNSGGVSGNGGSPAGGTNSNMAGASNGDGDGDGDGSGGTPGSGGDGSGGSSYDGSCSGMPEVRVDQVDTGDYAVYTCKLVQSKCTAEMIAEPALFQCIDSHANNCNSQDPTGGSSWKFVGLCSDLGMGGANMGGEAGN